MRKYLDPAIEKPLYKPRSKRQGKPDPHKSYLEERLKEGVWNAAILLRELRERGYAGGYTIIGRDCLNAMEWWDGGCVDCIVTSPPCNIGIKFRTAKCRPAG